ncbi:RHS repeat-associated core domain-containing protein [Pseudomonas sp. TWI929]|uniref:RHS repeat-associated core domain-containing protein n=1 Tax=Pseudomonas sp. TWI929 TaxID=3136795 RepID=UPI00320B7201
MKTKQKNNHFFYAKNKLISKLGDDSLHIFRATSSPLAELRNHDFSLLAIDNKKSLTVSLSKNSITHYSYTPYGYNSNESTPNKLLGFNGEPLNEFLHHYLLGSGYRYYNPRLMRFCSPDLFSPFLKGGLNSYTYCLGDPVNLVDPSGEAPLTLEMMNNIKILAKNRVTLQKKSAAETKRLNNAQAEHKRLSDKHISVGKAYGLDQKSVHGSRVSASKRDTETSKTKQGEIITLMVEQTDIINDAKLKLKDIEKRFNQNEDNIQNYQDAYGPGKFTDAFEKFVKEFREGENPAQ